METINIEKKGIGTLGEKTLHATLKHHFEPDATKHEIKMGSFIADIVKENDIIEIQTSAFDRLRKKLTEFLEMTSVTIVYPIPKTKWLLWIDEETGIVTKKRKSPRRGHICDAIFELYKIKSFLNHPNFHFCIIFVDTEEYRYLNGWSKDKKKGSTRHDRIPVEIAEEVWFTTTTDYLQFIPAELQQPFTSKDYHKIAKISLRTAQTTLNILYHLGVVKRTGKQGNAYLYERVID